MPNLRDIDFQLESALDASIGTLLSRVLEQQAQLADQAINQALLTELIGQFVEAERRLAEAHAAVVALSRTDALTGIANRRWFDEVLDHELARAKRSKAPIGLLMIDIDYFKLFNDNYGHATGDNCLRQVAQTIRGVVMRAPDFTARYGGEEIACILPDTRASGLIKVGNTVLQAVRSLGIPHAHSKASKSVTISIGGTSMIPGQETTPTDVIKEADRMLYASKAGGRDRLTVIAGHDQMTRRRDLERER